MAYQLFCQDDTRWSVEKGAHGDLIVKMFQELLLAACAFEQSARPRLPGQGRVILFTPELRPLRGWLSAHRRLDKELPGDGRDRHFQGRRRKGDRSLLGKAGPVACGRP